MGLFDFFKKKSSDEEKPTKDEDKIVIKVENTDDSAPGWEAIEAEFNRLYPDQPSPLHYVTVIKYMLGGPDPLDGISVYDAGDFWHFVSYGLSELYTKESEDPEYSGYGIELTFKLKKSNNDEEEIKNGCGLLQYVARYIFKTGKVVLPEEYIYTKQTVGIDAQQKSNLTGFLTAADDLAKPLDTPHGEVEFVTLIGATDAELRSIYESETSKLEVRKLLKELGDQLTDYNRQSLI